MPKEVKWAISLAVGLGLLWIGWKFYAMLVVLHVVDLRCFDCCDYAAERRGSRPGGRIRRRGQPNGFRASRRGNVSFQGHHLVRHHVHADVHGFDHAPEHGCGFGWQFHLAAVLEDFEVGPGGARSSSSACGACSVEINSLDRFSAVGCRATAVAFHLTPCGSGGTGRRTILRGWRRKAWGFESPLPHT